MSKKRMTITEYRAWLNTMLVQTAQYDNDTLVELCDEYGTVNYQRPDIIYTGECNDNVLQICIGN